LKDIPVEIYILFGQIITLKKEAKKLRNKLNYKFDLYIKLAKDSHQNEINENRFYDDASSSEHIKEGELNTYIKLKKIIVEEAIIIGRKSKKLKKELYIKHHDKKTFIDELFNTYRIESNISGDKRQATKGKINNLIKQFRNIHRTGNRTDYPPNGEFEELNQELFSINLEDKKFIKKLNETEEQMFGALEYIFDNKKTFLNIKEIRYNTKLRLILDSKVVEEKSILLRNKIETIITELEILFHSLDD
jgi:hypothetical protein